MHMQDLPRDIDPDVVIEIDRRLDDDKDLGPVPVNDLVRRIRQTTRTRLSDKAVEELVVAMASKRGLTMIFDKTAI
jgi:hypothetical protein